MIDWSLIAGFEAPYLGLKGQEAVKRLTARPLTLTPAQGFELQAAVRASHLQGLRVLYGSDSKVPFDRLPDAAQTTIASCAWQYGNLPVRCPRFWKAAIVQDWPAVIAELRNFGDEFPRRRNAEADYLAAHLQPRTQPAF